MTKGGSRQMKIKINTETGNTHKVVDEYGNPATPVTQEEMEKIYQSQKGFKYVGVILHAESSPGCVYYVIAGRAYKVCW